MAPITVHGYRPITQVGEILTGRLNFLIESSAILASCLDQADIFNRLAHLAVPFLADWCSIVVIDKKSGQLNRVAVAHVNPKVDLELQSYRNTSIDPNAEIGIPKAIRTGQSELLQRINATEFVLQLGGRDPKTIAAAQRFGVSSMMTAPLLAHGEILGAISLVVGSERREFERSDLALAEEISRRAAFALYSLNRIRNTTVERDRLKEVIRLYEHFIECRSEDSVSPLTAARLKVELINRSEISIERQATLEKVLEDIDRATSMITSLAKHEVIQNLMNRERAEADQKAA